MMWERTSFEMVDGSLPSSAAMHLKLRPSFRPTSMLMRSPNVRCFPLDMADASFCMPPSGDVKIL